MNCLKQLTLTALLALCFGKQALAQDEKEPSFECVAKTLAIYSPGPKWGELNQSLESHMHFIASMLNANIVEDAGPIIDAQGVPDGGISIYASDDLTIVKNYVESDPLIQNKVSIYVLKTWRNCSLN